MSNYKAKHTQRYVGADLHDGQKRIVTGIISSDALFYTIVCPRQWGKSCLVTQLILYYAINKPNSKILYTSPTYDLCGMIFREVYGALKGTDLISTKTGAFDLKLINNSEILCRSITRPEGILGRGYDYMFCDEAAIYKSIIFDQTLVPMLGNRGKKCFLISTPRGTNWFHSYYKDGNNPDKPGFASFKGYPDENPYRNLRLVATAKSKMPENLFRQEFEAEFVDGGEVFPNIREAAIITKWSEPISGESYYGGIDIASKNDYTVFTILDSKGKVCACYRDTGKTGDEMLFNFKKLFDKYNPKVTYVEDNGIGKIFVEYIEKLHRSVKRFDTNNSSKQRIIYNLIYKLQTRSIFIPEREFFPFYYDEMCDFGYEITSSDNIRYRAETGHDDCVMSLAFAAEALTKGSVVTRTIIV